VKPEANPISALGISFTYRSGRTGLEPLDLEIGPAEVVAVLGPNGSGKSTLLRTLATDLRPTGGTLSLFGRPAIGRLAHLRQQIGYAADTPVHFDVLTGQENADSFRDLAPSVAGSERSGAVESWNGDDSSSGTLLRSLFEAFDLDHVSRIPVAEYSFGMRRKLLLLEALSLSPPLLLLDEPSVGLDPSGIIGLRRAIEDLQRRGSTVVIASNEVRVIPRWADRVLFLNRGELIEDAPLADLLRRLEGRTRIEIDLVDPEANRTHVDLSGVGGVLRSEACPAGVVVESSQQGRPLPALIDTLLQRGCQIRDVRVREPDLGDLFFSMTGESLGEPGMDH